MGLTDGSETPLLSGLNYRPAPSFELTENAWGRIVDVCQIPQSCRDALNWKFEHYLLTASGFARSALKGFVRKSLIRMATGNARPNDLKNLHTKALAMLRGTALVSSDLAVQKFGSDKNAFILNLTAVEIQWLAHTNIVWNNGTGLRDWWDLRANLEQAKYIFTSTLLTFLVSSNETKRETLV